MHRWTSGQSALQNLDRRSERIDRCKAAGMAENVAAEVGSGWQCGEMNPLILVYRGKQGGNISFFLSFSSAHYLKSRSRLFPGSVQHAGRELEIHGWCHWACFCPLASGHFPGSHQGHPGPSSASVRPRRPACLPICWALPLEISQWSTWKENHQFQWLSMPSGERPGLETTCWLNGGCSGCENQMWYPSLMYIATWCYLGFEWFWPMPKSAGSLTV